MALAGDEVADRHEVEGGRRARGEIGTEVDDAHVAGTESAAALGDQGRVRQGQPRRAERGPDRLAAALEPLGHAEHVTAMDADHQRDLADTPDRIPRGSGIVRVHEIEATAHRQRERRRGPCAPGGVRARARWRDERNVGDAKPVELGAQRLVKGRGERLHVTRAERGLRRHRPVQDEDLDVRTRVARGERLAVRPDAERRIRPARVVLGDDRDLHGSARYSPTVAVRRASRRHRRRGTPRLRRSPRRGDTRPRPVSGGGPGWRRSPRSPNRNPRRERSRRRRAPSPCAGPGTAATRAPRPPTAR